jgi:hypothetical protein
MRGAAGALPVKFPILRFARLTIRLGLKLRGTVASGCKSAALVVLRLRLGVFLEAFRRGRVARRVLVRRRADRRDFDRLGVAIREFQNRRDVAALDFAR